MDMTRTCCFLLTSETAAHELTDLLGRGLEDILDGDAGLDLLITKMHKVRTQMQQQKAMSEQSAERSGARGRLSDMNLIDLLQALGPGLKTARLDIKPAADESVCLTMYLNEGRIVYAEAGPQQGAEAVYRGLTWSDGTWAITPVSPTDLPPSNNSLTNESILMEGCRRLDEMTRKGQLV
jgi:hypothetical protein